MLGHRRQPKSLEDVSLGRVCEQLDKTCRYLQVLSQHSSVAQALAFTKRAIRPYYVNTLSVHLRSRAIKETWKLLYVKSTSGSHFVFKPTTLFLLALLLGRDIKQLKVYLCCYYGCSHQTSLLKLLATEGTGLQSLHLIRSTLLRFDCDLLRPALLNMKNLTSLTLRNIANNNMLHIIGKTCPKLIILDVAGSRQVTDTGLKNLLVQTKLVDKTASLPSQTSTTNWSRLKQWLIIVRAKMINSKSMKKVKKNVLLEYYESKNSLCDTLKVLNIASTTVSSTGVLLALLHIPGLESLAGYNYVERVMEIVNKNLIDFQCPLNLVEAKTYRTTSIQLKYLAQTCPKMEKLCIVEPRHSAEALHVFSHVTSLSVHCIPAGGDWLNNFYHTYLRTSGQNLRELNLQIKKAPNVSSRVNLKEIFSCCPNLMTLVIDNGSDIIWTEGSQDPPPLRDLMKIQLGNTVNALTIIKVLLLAPQLTALHVYNCFDLTNEHLKKLLKPTTKQSRSSRESDIMCDAVLQNLTCFYINEASKLSAIAVLNMFNNYKRLKLIGNLKNWDLYNEGIGNNFIRANSDVDFCSTSHWVRNKCISMSY